MAETNPPLFVQEGGETPAQFRRWFTRLFSGREGVLDPLSFVATPNTPAAMNVVVSPGWGFIMGTENANQGGYPIEALTSETVPIDPSHASLNRIDTIIARVYDQEYLVAPTTEFKLEVVKGTNASTPSAPALPTNSYPLWDVSVPATVTTITLARLTDRRRFISMGVPPGTIVDFVGASAPPAWLICAGQAVSRTTYGELFALLGTTFGVGDGSTTFNLPDLRGRVGVGLDNMGGSDSGRLDVANTLGGSGGAQKHTLLGTEMPPHSHNIHFGSGAGAGAGIASPIPSTPPHNIQPGYLSTDGGGQPHNNMQPYLLLNKIIKVA